MTHAFAIARRELAAYFYSPVAYVFLGFFLITAGALYFWMIGGGVFVMGRATLRTFFILGPWLFMVFGPAVTMRLIAEERKSGTLEVLMTLPVTEAEVVAGKFLGAMGLVAVGLIATFPIPLVISTLVPEGFTFDWGPVVGGYAGLFLLASSFIAIGMWSSAITKNQIVSFLIGLLICISLVWFIDALAYRVPPGAARFLHHVSVISHFENIARGVIDSRDVLFYLTLTYLGLRATVSALRAARQ